MTVFLLDVPEPSYSAPWMHWFSGFTGWILATCLFLVGIVMVTGLCAWVWGKMDSSGRAQTNGLIGFGLAAVAAAVISVAGSIIVWASNLGPNWANF